MSCFVKISARFFFSIYWRCCVSKALVACRRELWPFFVILFYFRVSALRAGVCARSIYLQFREVSGWCFLRGALPSLWDLEGFCRRNL